MRILVVDDDPEIVSFVKRGLAYEGYKVDTAGDGTEALTKAHDREPDLVPAWRKGGSADPIKQLVKDAWVLITNSHLWVVANFNTHEWEQYGVNLRCSFCPINTDSDMSQ